MGREEVCVCGKMACVCVCVCHTLVLRVSTCFTFPPPPRFSIQGRGCKQPIQSCTNEDTGCVLVISIWDAKSTYLQLTLAQAVPILLV